MVKRTIILMTVILLVGCDKKLFDLSMSKAPYAGDELRIDGYYYSDPTYAGAIGLAIFYRDGICIHTRVNPVNQDILDHIENGFLLNEMKINKIKNIPSHIGVFKVNAYSIEFETWEYRNQTFSHYGKILNDTTFLLTRRVNNRINESFKENLVYRFKQFSPKPDSTTRFIK